MQSLRPFLPRPLYDSVILLPDVLDARCLQGFRKCLNNFSEENYLSGNKIQKYRLSLRLIIFAGWEVLQASLHLLCSSTLIFQTSLAFDVLPLDRLSMAIHILFM